MSTGSAAMTARAIARKFSSFLFDVPRRRAFPSRHTRPPRAPHTLARPDMSWLDPFSSRRPVHRLPTQSPFRATRKARGCGERRMRVASTARPAAVVRGRRRLPTAAPHWRGPLPPLEARPPSPQTATPGSPPAGGPRKTLPIATPASGRPRLPSQAPQSGGRTGGGGARTSHRRRTC
eukprot:scaffold31649_cov101-Isochrysis_galbana.AAC.3